MKEIFKMHKKGLTILELLVVIGLVGLIFGLGIYPIMTQLKLFGAERSGMTLSDDANLAVYWITKDALKATNAQIAGGVLTFQYRNPTSTVTYTATTTSLLRNGQVITNKLVPPAFSLPASSYLPTKHRLHAENLTFKDTKTNQETKRSFDVMLRCRDARL